LTFIFAFHGVFGDADRRVANHRRTIVDLSALVTSVEAYLPDAGTMGRVADVKH
jgi:hypothetical protein